MQGVGSKGGEASGRASERDRRRKRRITLGLPVRVQVAGSSEAETVELRDVSESGAFLATNDPPRVTVEQRVALGFVLPGQTVGLARGRVVRIEREGFAVEVDSKNAPFDAFLRELEPPEPLAA